MAKFCFVIHPLSFEDVVRYEPGARGKGKPIIAKIMEWMPSWAAAHVTGIRTPDGRETEGWFVAAGPIFQAPGSDSITKAVLCLVILIALYVWSSRKPRTKEKGK